MTGHATHFLVRTATGAPDPVGRHVADEARGFLGIETGRIEAVKVYTVFPSLAPAQVERVLEGGIADAVGQEVLATDSLPMTEAAAFLAVDRLPGVTDDEGRTVVRVLHDILGDRPTDPRLEAHSRTVYLIEESLSGDDLRRLAEDLVGNPLVHHLTYGPLCDYAPPAVARPSATRPPAETIDLQGSDDELLALSSQRLLSLDLAEMKAISAHFASDAVKAQRRERGLPVEATDCELEILAQTWSEHCKHKEFSALIDFEDQDAGRHDVIDSLFDTYIKQTTRRVEDRLRSWGQNWLLKVFDDNAGVVRIDNDRVFVWKVETHNSPSALDPYGGAITGILGNNRDPLGTGRGGGRLLFNTNVLCFGPPDYDKPLLPGQLHPARVLAGVRKGIEDGGNKSGVPTVNGAIVFDDRYSGKPLVYCGTGSIAPAAIDGVPWWEKRIDPGDRIVMAGGRVGKDGIHGATFSSDSVGESTPRSVVQIGSPITQKMLSDFLEAATARGLVKCCTDNGAGGLSSSVGELARLSGGADVDVSRVPLKYEGIAAWEIFVSESQERMTLVAEPSKLDELLALADAYEVEATDIGAFTEDGILSVRYGAEPVAALALEFLHDGVPRKRMKAQWRTPAPGRVSIPEDLDHAEALAGLLARPNVCSREGVIRQYDHEVKGRTVIKPLMGRGSGPQDAAVLRLGFDDYRGVAVSNGILPRYGDLDPYAMSAGAFDEAVRQIVAVGGRLPGPDSAEPAFWSVNDNFCVPNVAYDARFNPEGKERLGKLIRMCQGLQDMAVAYAIPLTSGKDSMKNDFHAGGQTISVPPTVLYSMAAGIPDVRKTVTAGFQAPGDVIYQLGATYDELGGSEILGLLGLQGGRAPQVRPDDALRLYRAVAAAAARGWIASCHDLSDGGLAVGLAESAIGSEYGFDVTVDDLSGIDRPHTILYAESHSRFVASVRTKHAADFEALLGRDAVRIGRVIDEGRVIVRHEGSAIIDEDLDRFASAWRSGLGGAV